MRCFIAITPPENVRKRLARLSETVLAGDKGIRRTPVENLHLTLRFLGDIDEATASDLFAYIEQNVSGMGPFPVVVRGTGAFPSVTRPNVVWAGVEAPDTLVAVQTLAETAARRAGLAPEKKRFRPHITLGRVRQFSKRGGVTDFLKAHTAFEAGEFRADSVSLLRSDLMPEGAQHTVVKTCQL